MKLIHGVLKHPRTIEEESLDAFYPVLRVGFLSFIFNASSKEY